VKNLLALVCRTCAAGAVALFVSANASAGVVFRGAIDPLFGLGISGLSYSGDAFFDVSPDCLNAIEDGTHDPNGDTCGGMTLVSETITLTNGSATQTLNFWPDATFTPTQPITSFEIFGGTLAGVDTVPVGPQFVTVAGLGYTGPLWLELFTTFSGGDSNVPNPQAVLITGQCFGGEFPSCSMDPDTPTTGRSNPATVTITQVVPEPGTVALVIGAMTAGWIVRRRRSSSR